MTMYTVRAERAGKWWMLQCAEVPGAISQVRKLSEADVIKESLAFVTDTTANDIEIELEVAVNPDHDELIREYSKISKSLDQLGARQRELQSQLLEKLIVEDDLNYRDVGVVLHLSHQRIGQLAEGAKLTSKSG
jgi:hypothetical protein